MAQIPEGCLPCCPGRARTGKIQLTVLSMFPKKMPAKATKDSKAFLAYDWKVERAPERAKTQ